MLTTLSPNLAVDEFENGVHDSKLKCRRLLSIFQIFEGSKGVDELKKLVYDVN